MTRRGTRARSGRVAVKRGFINLSIGVVRRHVRFGVVHEGYNHEPGAKGVAATLHACESLRRATVALEPAGTGALKAARSPRGGSIERTCGALKQYEYPICEIMKTGLLPPGVINTGEFVHHRAWVGRASRDAAMRLSFYRVLSLARELVSRRRADVPRVTTGAAPAHATASSTSPALQPCSVMPAPGEPK